MTHSIRPQKKKLTYSQNISGTQHWSKISDYQTQTEATYTDPVKRHNKLLDDNIIIIQLQKTLWSKTCDISSTFSLSLLEQNVTLVEL